MDYKIAYNYKKIIMSFFGFYMLLTCICRGVKLFIKNFLFHNKIVHQIGVALLPENHIMLTYVFTVWKMFSCEEKVLNE